MLKIRLKRAGGRNHPFYRVVVIDSRKARDSRAVEEIGYYNPLEDPIVFHVDRERVEYWTAHGAQVTDSVKSLLRRENTVHVSKRETAAFEPVAAAAPKAKPEAAGTAVATEAAPEAEATAEAATEPEAAAESAPEAKPAEAPESAPESEAAPEAKAEAEPAVDEKKDDA